MTSKKDCAKDPMLVLNTSSPDRSMDVLPALWKRVKAQVPQARMVWCYGWDIFVQSYAHDPKKMEWMQQTQKAMDEAGIESLGRVSQSEVGRWYRRASILAYPSTFAEIDCISVKKAQAAGCFPIATDFGAFSESIVWGVKVHTTTTKDNWAKPYQFTFGLTEKKAQDDWVAQVVYYLKNGIPKTHPDMRQFEWSKIAERWHEILCA